MKKLILTFSCLILCICSFAQSHTLKRAKRIATRRLLAIDYPHSIRKMMNAMYMLREAERMRFIQMLALAVNNLIYSQHGGSIHS